MISRGNNEKSIILKICLGTFLAYCIVSFWLVLPCYEDSVYIFRKYNYYVLLYLWHFLQLKIFVILQLQKSVAGQYNEIKMWKERVESNDKAARKAIEGYKTDHQANIDKVR